MHFKGIEICCPVCKGDLHETNGSEKQLFCESCGKSYPVILDIPDLRIFPDPYIGFEADREKGRKLASKFEEFNFEGFVDYYYEITPVVTRNQAQQFKRGLMGAQSRSKAAFKAWEERVAEFSLEKENEDGLLEIGCGTAQLLIAAREQYEVVVGVDIAFRWLVMAKKRLIESGFDFPLFCACAEALPFKPDSFCRVVGESTIEHSKNQIEILSECYRVLSPGGYLFLSTPNRFSLAPDPHTGIIAGGYLPQFISSKYIIREGGIPPHRRLLSRYSLSKLLSKAGFSHVQFFLPDFPDEQRIHFSPMMNKLVNIYQYLKKISIANFALFLFGPLIYAICQKGERY